jgi:hypothetical protein
VALRLPTGADDRAGNGRHPITSEEEQAVWGR